MRRALAFTGTVAMATGGWFLFGGDDASAAPVDAVFEYSGAEEPFVVPAEVCEVTVLSIGAAGGDGNIAILGVPAPEGQGEGPGVGALGGSTTATFAVTPGETLDVVVGGAGGDGQNLPVPPIDEQRADAGPTPTGIFDNGGSPGFNGGGSGGDGPNAGGGGGGASEVFRGESAVVVAGGGGGGAGFNAGGDGGAGGGPGENGGDGGVNQIMSAPTPQGDGDPARGGDSGGNGGAGGAGATGPNGGSDGGAGSPGTGGDGAEGLDAGGAGGGGAQGGGGGGSNDTGEGFGGGGGGGAGSSAGPEGSVFGSAVDGDAEGNGLIVISYDPAAQTCGPQAVVVEPRFTG